TRGRFRVKANVDQATADRYARELEALGARVQIEEAVGSTRTSALPIERTRASSSPGTRRTPTPTPMRTPSATPPAGTSGVLMPIGGEVRDRAADPAARGPRQRLSPGTAGSAAGKPFREVVRDRDSGAIPWSPHRPPPSSERSGEAPASDRESLRDA